jgi:hypothetical protein
MEQIHAGDTGTVPGNRIVGKKINTFMNKQMSMKMKQTGWLAFLLLAASFGRAQQGFITWEPNPQPHKVSTRFAKESAVVLHDKRMHVYKADPKEGLRVHITNYKLIKVNDDKGVEMYNRTYLPVPGNGAITNVKARVISPGGKVTDLPDNKIFDVEEEGRRYKKFAMEGVESGSEVEYMYTTEKDLYFFGLEVLQNNASPTELAEFVLMVPEHLVFSVKGYNGVQVSTDTVINQQRVVTASSENIMTIDEEKYGERTPMMRNIQYKLSYNLAKDKASRLFTWSDLAKNVYTNYSTATDKEAKAVADFLKGLPLSGNESEEQKVVALEDYLKSAINVDKDAIGEDASKIERIVKTKVADYEGFIRLFILSMEKLAIRYQIVYPSKRNDLPLDEKLENFRLAEEIAFFFPSTGNFLEPVNQMLRYPFIDPFMAATKGLFIKPTTIGSFKSAIALFDSIPIKGVTQSTHDMQVSMRFNEALDSVLIHSQQQLLGYGAMYYRPALQFLPKDKAEEFKKEIVKSVANSENIRNIKVANTAMTDYYLNKPFIIEADITNGNIVEQAGGKLLLKIGEVIGPQAEMYQEKPRQLPITMQYPHNLDRDIQLEIPAGYFIKNPDDIKFNVTDLPGDKATMGFISNYTIVDNKLIIKVHEFYTLVNYPIGMLEPFKKIINASADFNKVVLVLEKKK